MDEDVHFNLCISTMFVMFRRDYLHQFPYVKDKTIKKAFLNSLHEKLFDMKPNKMLQREINAVK